MLLIVFLLFLLVVLITTGLMKLRVWESGMHMINVDWLDASEKFKFVARWGS